ncbi:MAG TPA: TraR/DksA C4-type zinc finger protein [Gaiellaceae bacterium]|nr:TraR/DksA C4-type zinc finger protein [Gaiellaceae bacterium]
MSTQIDTGHFRARLEAELAKARSAIKYLHKENPGAIEDITGDLAMGPGDNHLADLATDTIDREIDDTLEENSANIVREIESALIRIDDGTYGLCTACGKPIEPERLEYLPWATQCAADARGARG